MLSVRKTRLVELADQGSAGARAVLALRANPERFLATVQVGITVVSATAAAFGGASLAVHMAPFIARIPLLADSAEQVALTLVVALVSFLSLVLGELVPKSLALRRGERYALLAGRPLLGLAFAARPVVWVLTATSNLVLKLFGDETSFTEARLSREELQQLMEEATVAGSLDASVGEIAARALDFEGLDAADMMVPRARIQTLAANIDAESLFAVARAGAHSRLPVVEGDLDSILGVVTLRDALAAARGPEPFDVRGLMHPVPFVGPNLPAPDLLRTLQSRRAQLALVVDEHGSVRGLVSFEDLLEELVGEIMSEDEVPVSLVAEHGPGAWDVDGRAPIHEVNRALDLDLPEGDAFSTMAGLCIHLSGHIPSRGEVLEAGDGVRLRVLDAGPRRVRQVRLEVERTTAPEEAASA